MAAYFWKVPNKQDGQRSYDNENYDFAPGWNGHGIPFQTIRYVWFRSSSTEVKHNPDNYQRPQLDEQV